MEDVQKQEGRLSLRLRRISEVNNVTFCSLVVRVPGYISRGAGSIPGSYRFSEKQWVWNGVHSAS
jgi:hypothetical protein